MVNVTEVWKPVVGREFQFEVSSLGRVKALSHSVGHWSGQRIEKPERIVNQSRHSGGYKVVSLRDNRKHYVHRLVMAAFVGPADSGQDVNHIDGNKSNNALANLEYCDRLRNVRHAIAAGLQDNAGEANGMNKYSAKSVREAVQMVRGGASVKAAANSTGVGAATIKQVMKGRQWKHLLLATA